MSEKTARLPHASIIASPSSQAREEAALELACALVCQSPGERPCKLCRDCRKAIAGVHPDLIYVRRREDSSGKPRREIYVEQIRALGADALVLPNEAEKKVYIIPEAEFMNQPAQNAFLKLLEEPPAHAAFILCVSSAESLLDTIRSRCEKRSINEDAPAASSELARPFLEALASGQPEKLLLFCTANEGVDSAAAQSFVQASHALVSEMLCLREPSPGLSRPELYSLLKLLDTAGGYLRANVGVRHVFGLLQTADMLIKR